MLGCVLEPGMDSKYKRQSSCKIRGDRSLVLEALHEGITESIDAI